MRWLILRSPTAIFAPTAPTGCICQIQQMELLWDGPAQNKVQTRHYDYLCLHCVRFEGEAVPRQRPGKELDPGASARQRNGVVSHVGEGKATPHFWRQAQSGPNPGPLGGGYLAALAVIYKRYWQPALD